MLSKKADGMIKLSVCCLIFALIALFGPYPTSETSLWKSRFLSLVFDSPIALFSPIAGPRTFSYLLGFMSVVFLIIGNRLLYREKMKQFDTTLREPELHQETPRKKIWAEGQHPLHVRLVPQIPIRTKSTSWFGGNPFMPASIKWPVGADGLPMQFLAQIDLSKAPNALWEGLGPRSGWLLFFTNYEFGGAKVIHTEKLGSSRTAPPIPASRVSEYGPWFNTYGLSDVDLVHLGKTIPADHRPPYWPVDITTVAEGTWTQDWNYRQPSDGPSPLRRLHQTGYDLREEHLAPFDWHSVWLLVHASQCKVWSIQKHVQKWLKTAQNSIESLEKKRPDGYAKDVEAHHSKAVALQSNLDVLASTEAKLLALEKNALELAKHRPFTVEIRDEYFAQITQLPIPRCRDWGNEEPDFLSLVSTPDFEGGLRDYVNLLLDYAKKLYSGSLKPLSPPMLNFLINEVQHFGPTEYGLSGHHAIDALPAFNKDEEIGLLQLPSSSLMGWQWGDVHDVAFSISKSDLESHIFENIKLVVTN